MNRVVGLLGGVFGMFCFSWAGLVVLPYSQLARLQPHVDEDAQDVYPIPAGGLVAEGRRVYAANGCVHCHTQQVRPGFAGADIERQWGYRQTVARDYLYETPVLLGTTRIGPDLANIGARYPNPMIANLPEEQRLPALVKWHHLHLYNPRLIEPDSVMPPFRFLYKTRKIAGQRAMDALELPRDAAPPRDYEVVPSDDARALVAYLLSLKREHPLAEAIQEKKPPEPAAPQAATQPAASPQTTPAAPGQAPAAAQPAASPPVQPSPAPPGPPPNVPAPPGDSGTGQPSGETTP
jgi:cytochrome c oxidase cbb3-type subunit II